MNAEEFLALRATERELRAIRAVADTLYALVEAGQYAAALPLACDLEAKVSRVGPENEIRQRLGQEAVWLLWPYCLACYPTKSTGEILLAGHEVPTLCASDEGARVCPGNRGGRMHPVQLREWLEKQCAITTVHHEGSPT